MGGGEAAADSADVFREKKGGELRWTVGIFSSSPAAAHLTNRLCALCDSLILNAPMLSVVRCATVVAGVSA